MKKFIVEDGFWELFPGTRIGVVVCRNVDNSIKDTVEYEKMLRQAEREAGSYFKEEALSSNPVIAVWRDAFKKFKTKKGARSSIEALLKRVQKGGQIGTINPLVDIYNSISIRYALPCGGEDMDAFEGDLRLTKAVGNEQFVPLGSSENEPPYPDKIVYKDDKGAVCRCWNWREAQRTILTEDTKNVFFCIELVDDTRTDEFNSALKELAELVSKYLGGTVETHVLDINKRKIDIYD